jgi:hypothetical protein
VKECFCGCGRRIGKFPLGQRSINKRGQLVAERLAYARAMRDRPKPDAIAEEAWAEIHHGDPDWYEHGEEIIAGIRAAMHGEADARALDPDESGEWLAYGGNAELVEVQMLGSPPINSWLLDPESQRLVAALARGQ